MCGLLLTSQEPINNVAAMLYSVVLKAAKRDSPDELNFGIICFSIKGYFHISKRIVAIITDIFDRICNVYAEA